MHKLSVSKAELLLMDLSSIRARITSSMFCLLFVRKDSPPMRIYTLANLIRWGGHRRELATDVENSIKLPFWVGRCYLARNAYGYLSFPQLEVYEAIFFSKSEFDWAVISEAAAIKAKLFFEGLSNEVLFNIGQLCFARHNGDLVKTVGGQQS